MKTFLSLCSLVSSIFMLSCHSNGYENDNSSATNDSTSVAGLTGDPVKLTKSASIKFKVKDVEQSTRSVSALTQKLGGIIYYQDVEFVEDGRNELRISKDSLMVITAYTPQADITVRIPSENLEAFMYGVADLGYFTSSSKLLIDDKSLIYLENELKQHNRINVLSNLTIKKSKSPTNIQTITVNDEVIEQQINNKAINADVKYSSVKISLFQNAIVRKEFLANYTILDYQLPLSQRLVDAVEDGMHYFSEFILVLIRLWLFILLSITIFLSYRHLQQKRKHRELRVKPQ